MAGRVVDPIYAPLTVTTPAGTTPANPLVTAWALPPGRVETMDLVIPYGHVAATGIRITVANQQIFPWSTGVSWLTGEDLRETFEIGIYAGNGINVVTFNTGVFTHSHYLLAKVRQLPDVPVASTPAPIPLTLLNGGLAQ